RHQAHPTQHHPHNPRQPTPPPGTNRHQRPHPQLPQPRRSHKERRLRITRRIHHREDERRHDHHTEPHPHHRQQPSPSAPTHQPAHQHQQQRPHDIELLLHRQRPKMLNRRNPHPLSQIIHRPSSPHPIHHIQRRTHDVPTKSAPLHHRPRSPRQDRSDHQHQPRRRQQPLRPPRLTPRQRHPPLLLQLPDQQPRDQEPRDHKENINPHKPTRKHLHHTRVIDQHQPNRNSPQPLNIRPKTPTPHTRRTHRGPPATHRTLPLGRRCLPCC